MTRSQRRWHVWIWLIVAPLAITGVVVGLAARIRPPVQSAMIPRPDPVAVPFVGPPQEIPR